MMKALDRVHLKLKQLRHKASDEFTLSRLPQEDQQRLREMDLRAELRKSRNAVYEYLRLKSEDGKKKEYSHQAGADRYEKAASVLNTLDALGEELRLVSPAARFLDATQLELLEKRCDAQWMADNAEDYAARMIYGMQLSFKDKSWKEEEYSLSDVRVARNVELIKRDPAFRHPWRKPRRP